MTILADCIARYEAVQAQPINIRTSALTPRGQAIVAGRRFAATIANRGTSASPCW